jgi:hypothetical protein
MDNRLDEAAQVLKKFVAFYESRRFITVFTRDCHSDLSFATLIQPVSLHFIILPDLIIISCEGEGEAIPVQAVEALTVARG